MLSRPQQPQHSGHFTTGILIIAEASCPSQTMAEIIISSIPALPVVEVLS